MRYEDPTDPADPPPPSGPSIPPGYLASDFFYSFDYSGNTQEAKYMRDDNGNYIIDPNTNAPLIMPAHFDLKAFIAEYQAMQQQVTNAVAAGLDYQTVENLRLANQVTLGIEMFPKYPGSKWDLQRNYNGLAATSVVGFVKDFRNGGNWLYGVAQGILKTKPQEAAALAGALNLTSKLRNWDVNIDGPYGNNYRNYNSLMKGIADWTGTTVAQDQPATISVTDSTFTYNSEFYTAHTTTYDEGTSGEVSVQTKINTTTGDQAVTIGTDQWAVTFGAGGDSHYWVAEPAGSGESDPPPPASDGGSFNAGGGGSYGGGGSSGGGGGSSPWDPFGDGEDDGGFMWGGRAAEDTSAQVSINQKTADMTADESTTTSPSGKFKLVAPITASDAIQPTAAVSIESTQAALASAMASFGVQPLIASISNANGINTKEYLLTTPAQ